MGRAGRGGGGRGGRGGGFSGGGRGGSFSGGGRSGGSSGSNRSGRSSSNRSHRTTTTGWGVPYFRRHTGHYRPTTYVGMGSGHLSSVTIAILAAIFMLAFYLNVAGSTGAGGNVPRSTMEREALTAGVVQETGYYTDELGWIVNKSEMTSGLKHFYEKTGIQPYVYITDKINGNEEPSMDDLFAFAKETYLESFDDEAHFLLVFHEANGIYNCGYYMGSMAKSVLDDEAISILDGNIGRYYVTDVSEEEFFSLSFSKTADQIMKVYHSPWPYIIGICVIAIVVLILFTWWTRAKAQKNKEAEQLKDILSTPLDSFGESEAETLAKKYENND